MDRLNRRILIVDPDVQVRRSLLKSLSHDYDGREASTAAEAIGQARQFGPGIVLLDPNTPGFDCENTAQGLKVATSGTPPQVIMMSAPPPLDDHGDLETPPADDYLAKPIDPAELRMRLQLHSQLLRTAHEVQSLKNRLTEHHSTIQELASTQTQEVIEMQDLAVFTLASVAESRDNDTGQHLLRMREYTHLLAKQLQDGGPYVKQVDDRFLDDLYRSSPLHDIGKVGICDAILLKPGRLTPDEFEKMQRHTLIGANILDRAVVHSGSGGFLAMAAIIARFHHERWDGHGYPAGLVGHEIPLPARIVSVADVFDALTSTRPYKDAFPVLEAKKIIEAGSGSQFDPVIVEAFLETFGGCCAARDAHLDAPATAVGAISFLEYDFAPIEAVQW